MPRCVPSTSRAARCDPLRAAPPASRPPRRAGRAGALRSRFLATLECPPRRWVAANPRLFAAPRRLRRDSTALLLPVLLLLTLQLLPSPLLTDVSAESNDVSPPVPASPSSTKARHLASTRPSDEVASSAQHSNARPPPRVPDGTAAASGSGSRGKCTGEKCQQPRTHPKQPAARHAPTSKQSVAVRGGSAVHATAVNPPAKFPSTRRRSPLPSPSKKKPLVSSSSSPSSSSSSSSLQPATQRPAAAAATTVGAGERAGGAAQLQSSSKASARAGSAAAAAAPSPLEKIIQWISQIMGRRKRKNNRPPSPPPIDPRLGLKPPKAEVLEEAHASFNPVSPFVTTGVTFDAATGVPDYFSTLEAAVDHSEILSDPGDQGMCASCWAFAVEAAVQGAFRLFSGYFTTKTSLAVQQVLDCSVGGCRGGYPQDALQMWTERNVTVSDVYPYTAKKGECKEATAPHGQSQSQSHLSSFSSHSSSSPSFPSSAGASLSSSSSSSSSAASVSPLGYVSGVSVSINMFEQVPLPGAVGLMRVLMKQPVIVSIYASMQDFQAYDDSGSVYDNEECFDPSAPVLDHVVLVTGYVFGGVSSNENYFIIRNSWGTSWGLNGYMLISMTAGAAGICGMTYQRGLYPVLHTSDLLDPCAMAPCGAGTCTQTMVGSYTCQCEYPLADGLRRDGTKTCVLKKVCSAFVSNPCGTGQCADTGTGSYTCTCPSNYQLSALSTGLLTCVPSGASAPVNSYQVQAGDTCYGIYVFHGLSEADFLAQNQDVDCNNLQQGTYVQVERTTKPVCSVRYPISQADATAGNCNAINTRFSIDAATINPGLDCANLVPGQQICVEWSDFEKGSSNYMLCTQYQDITPTTTCASVLSTYDLTWRSLYRFNPGLLCDNINGLAGQEVCVAGEPLGAVACGPSRSKKVANRKYSVQGGDSCASLVVVQFKRQYPLVSELNRGWMCRTQSLYQGMPICIPS
ncbi:unnamed protein product [Closterium sp. NIES-64]|nr:unnamed protein product [Closterium sp. NIES-64]